MKNIKSTKIKFRKKGIFLITLLLFASLISCDKSVEEPTPNAISPQVTDESAGSWKTYILATATDVVVPEPTTTTSDAYKAELATLKTANASITPEQKISVQYWGAGAVYRWNEIARELAANHNLPPVYNVTLGKYPVPDAANPNVEPKFPFANPPYTSRALAYLSVAQYDALVATMAYKAKYSRQAPSKIDGSIKPYLPVNSLSTYPSEDAVVAQASYQVLIAMFPGDIPYLDSKLAEHKNTRFWAGMNVASELSAGVDLGKAVAAKVMAKAKGDGMAAANNQALTAGFIADAKTRGLTQEWKSLETPARPPMLPNFGAVATWNFDKAVLVQIRPKAPPALGSAEFEKDLNELRSIAKNQTREQARLANYWADGVGTYTPPGHWHRRAANLCNSNNFSEVRTARTLAMLGTAEMDAAISCWEAKFYYYVPRPFQMDNKVRTNLGVPNFPSYTSGHSTFSGAAATVLSYVFPNEATKLANEAKEASNSRIFGLIHFRFDCEVGLDVGAKVGQYAVNRGKADASGL